MRDISCYDPEQFDRVFRKYVGYQTKNEPTIAKFRKIYYDKDAEKIEHCSEYSNFKVCRACGSHHFNGTKVCKSRFCYVCAHKRGLLYLSRYGDLLKEYERQGYRIKMITLTMKNMENLQEMMDKFNNDFHRFRSYKLWKNNVLGAVASRETTYNFREDNWHFHIHVLAVMKDGCDIAKDDLSDYWKMRTGDSYIVDIRDTRKKLIDGVYWNTDFMELFKYCTKLKEIQTLPDSKFQEMVDGFYKARLLSAVGSMYGKVNDEEVEQELDSVDMRDLNTLCCAVCECDQFYDREERTRDVRMKVYRLTENKNELTNKPTQKK